jgi:deoxyribodipyrimidine photo-lyase
VVSDEFPEFFLPRMHRAAAAKLAARGVRLELVDGNGLLPLRAGEKAWTAAPHFRRQLQRALPAQLARAPLAEPLAAAPAAAGARRRRARARGRRAPALAGARARAARPGRGRAPRVRRAPDRPRGAAGAFAGGPAKAAVVLGDFLDRKLDTYAARRNEAEDPSNSGLLALPALGVRERARGVRAARRARGVDAGAPGAAAHRQARGWWGMSPNARRSSTRS